MRRTGEYESPLSEMTDQEYFEYLEVCDRDALIEEFKGFEETGQIFEIANRKNAAVGGPQHPIPDIGDNPPGQALVKRGFLGREELLKLGGEARASKQRRINLLDRLKENGFFNW